MRGIKRAVPFERTQQLVADGVVVRMAPGAQAGAVEGLRLPVKSAEQRSPVPKTLREKPLHHHNRPLSSVLAALFRSPDKGRGDKMPPCSPTFSSWSSAMSPAS